MYHHIQHQKKLTLAAALRPSIASELANWRTGELANWRTGELARKRNDTIVT
ncbi:hypothetical protein [Escherichia coli]|uniref:hypothetical protein n=1 Tax=Escherichia coli TaxID=562 RepID=UPI00157AD9E9|nr:hypothetical protein [Escherichia coli]